MAFLSLFKNFFIGLRYYSVSRTRFCLILIEFDFYIVQPVKNIEILKALVIRDKYVLSK